jgi:thiamine biosynthesis lipoprotein
VSLTAAKFEIWGLTGSLATESAEHFEFANERLWYWIGEIDRACNRFNDDSEIQRLNKSNGQAFEVSPTFEVALDAAIRSSEITGGLCDPTVLSALLQLGYNRDFDELVGQTYINHDQSVPSPGISAINFDKSSHKVSLNNCMIDFGASAKALTADLVANDVMKFGGVAVEIGGDVALRGIDPRNPWNIGISDSLSINSTVPSVAMSSGGIATSSLRARSWMVNGETANHIIDPRTGSYARGPYSTASVSAPDCVTANAFATAALLWGEDAGYHIAQSGWSARLVRNNGAVEFIGGWPEDGE